VCINCHFFIYFEKMSILNKVIGRKQGMQSKFKKKGSTHRATSSVSFSCCLLQLLISVHFVHSMHQLTFLNMKKSQRGLVKLKKIMCGIYFYSD
jgi:hypothetical protein